MELFLLKRNQIPHKEIWKPIINTKEEQENNKRLRRMYRQDDEREDLHWTPLNSCHNHLSSILLNVPLLGTNLLTCLKGFLQSYNPTVATLIGENSEGAFSATTCIVAYKAQFSTCLNWYGRKFWKAVYDFEKIKDNYVQFAVKISNLNLEQRI